MEATVRTKSLMEMMVLPIGLFFSMVYPYLFPNRRRRLNTCLIDRMRHELRKMLGWNISNFTPSESDSTSWRVLPLAVSAMLFGSTLVMLFEGKMDVVIHTIVLNSAYTTSLMLLPRHWFLSIGRLIAAHHFWHVWSRQEYYTSTGSIKRAVLGRALGAFIVLGDDIDDMFFQIAILDLIVLQSCGLDCEYSFLGLKMFCFSVLPLIILGFKDFAKTSNLFSMTSSSIIQDKIKQVFVSVLIPVITITTQANFSANVPDHISQFEILVNVLHSVVVLVCLTVPQMIDGVLADDKEWKLAEDLNKDQEVWSARGVTNICSVAASVILMEPSTIAPTMILAFVAHVFPERSRIATFVSHVLVLWATVGDAGNRSLSAKERFIVVALSTVRVALAFERRPISSVLRDISLLTAITMAIVKDYALIPSLSFVALVSSVVAIVVAQSRLHAVRVLMRERHSHAFLSHAIKQKYSGVGGALEALFGDAKFSNIMSIEVERLLRGALEECRQGERLCHTVNLVARIRQHTHVSSVTWNCLQTVLGQWRENGILSLASNRFYTFGKGGNGLIFQSSTLKLLHGDVHLNLDWDILKLCLCTWAFGSTELKIQVKETTPNEKKGDMYHQVELIMERIGGKRGIFQNNESALSTLLSVIGGRAVAENFIVLSCEALWDPKQGLEGSMSSLSSHDGGESGSIFSSMRDDDSNQKLLGKYDSISAANSLPSGLVFAILDDNALVRQNVERVCRSKLRADEQRSVFMGAKYEDCEAFLHLIVDNRVDIAIIDENLEYDENRIHVSGTWIARRARQMGFQGYLLLHSANHPVDGLDPCLDAFVEKSASRQQLVTNIINAVQSRPRLNKQSFLNFSAAGLDSSRSTTL